MANLVRERRKALWMTQQQLADAAEVSKRTIHNVERGCRSPSQRVRRGILRALGVPFEDRETIFPRGEHEASDPGSGAPAGQ